MIIVIYQKANGQLIERRRTTTPDYRVGDKTSMGWKVIDILYYYNGKYYPRATYNLMVDKEMAKYKRQLKIKRFIMKVYEDIRYLVALLIMIKLLQVLTK